MKLNKLFTIGLLSMFALASCDNVDEPVYTAAEPTENPEVCFKVGENTPIQLADEQSSFSVVVYRRNADAAATYTIQTSDAADIYTSYPTEVVFAQGEKTATFNVGIDFSKVVATERYNITFSLPGVSNTDYFLGTVTYTCYYEPWKTVTGPKGETTAKWRDNLIFGLYGVDDAYSEWEVTIEQSPTDPNIIRIPNPYSKSEYLQAISVDMDMSDDLYIYFNITDTEGVFFCDKNGDPKYLSSTGVTLNAADGLISVTSMANHMIQTGKKPTDDEYGKLRNGNLTWGVKQMLVSLSNEDGLYYGNGDGKFLLLWPGATETLDPSLVWTTIGEAQFTDGWMSPFLDEPAFTLPVTVQQNGANPDFYRLIDPFYYLIGDSPREGIYMYLDCSNHENVLIPLQESRTGLGMGNTSYYVSNAAEILMNWSSEPATAEEIIAAGYNSTFDGTTILVPAQNVVVAGVTNGQIGIEDITRPADGVIVLPTAEETAAYKKQNHFVKVPTIAERNKNGLEAIFGGKIVPINNIQNLKKYIK